MKLRMWGLFAVILAASAAQADVIRQERYRYAGGLAQFLVGERTWVVRAKPVAARAEHPPKPSPPLLAVRVGDATRPPQSEGPDRAASEDFGTRARFPEYFIHDAGTRDSGAVLEESP